MLPSKFTIAFHDFLALNPGWLVKNLKLDTDEHTAAFAEVLEAVWGIYEIAGSTDAEQKLFLKDTFRKHRDYYIEVLNAYEKEFDYTTANTHRHTYTNNSSVTHSGSDTDVHSDLPNKVVAPDSYEQYPTSADIHKAGTTDATTSGGTSTTYYDNEFLDMKRQYMRQLRNVYEEFANRFDDCFIHLF